MYGYSGNEEHPSCHGELRYHSPTASPNVLHDGHIADALEVVATKAEHFASVTKTKAYAGYGGDYCVRFVQHSEGYPEYSHRGAPHHGKLAKRVILKSRYLVDTLEVVATKAEHFASVTKTKAYAGYGGDYCVRFVQHSEGYPEYSHRGAPHHGKLAKRVILKSRYLVDTLEVVATKAEHFASVTKTKAYAGYGGDYCVRFVQHSEGYPEYSHRGAPHHGKLAKRVILKSRYLVDTLEVVATKAEHFASVTKTKAYAGYGGDYCVRFVQHSEGYPEYSHRGAPHHGKLAKRVILKSRYLIDTQEVVAAKHLLNSVHQNVHQNIINDGLKLSLVWIRGDIQETSTIPDMCHAFYGRGLTLGNRERRACRTYH
ncbi:hypothetical protein J6590_000961 [Homalodisca vitripennis]|nr:hypothetical protein J6590_000961 [Homalodisca vitripennis]